MARRVRDEQLGFTANYVCPVVRAFMQGKRKVGYSRNTFSTNGEILYSYRTPIAVKQGLTVHMLAPGWQDYSMTTGRQLREVVRCLAHTPVCYKSQGMIGSGLAQEIVDCHSSRPRPSRRKKPPELPPLFGSSSKKAPLSPSPKRKRKMGGFEGRIRIAPDFDAPLDPLTFDPPFKRTPRRGKRR